MATAIGGLLLAVGIFMAFLSSESNSQLLGKAQLGIGVLAPEEGSTEWQAKEQQLGRVKVYFRSGLGLTLLGIILQTLGAILPLKNTRGDAGEPVDRHDPPAGDIFSNQSRGRQAILLRRINERWGQLHALEKEWSERAIQFLFLTNAGGAIATLSFLGAFKQEFNRIGVKCSLALFVVGLIVVGLTIAKIYYHMSDLFNCYRRGAEEYFHDRISWDDMIGDDDRRSEVPYLHHVLAWLAFLFFALGCIVGGYSLFG